MKDLSIRNMFGHNTQQPFVLLRLGEEMAQISPTKAREIGHWLFEAAEAAEQDAVLVRFLKQQGLDERMCAVALTELRATRESQPEKPED